MGLSELRAQIDQIDNQLLRLLSDRAVVGALKKSCLILKVLGSYPKTEAMRS